MLYFLSGQPSARPERSQRLILDTNVAAPVLRWLAMGENPPSQSVTDAFTWLQARIRSAAVAMYMRQPRSVAVDMRWAAIETSRRAGFLEPDRLAQMAAAVEVASDFLESSVPIGQRFAQPPPRLRVQREKTAHLRGLSDSDHISTEAFCLLHLYKIDRDRRAGIIRTPNERLDALTQWTEDVAPARALSPHLIITAVQTALGGDGAPARTMCKFTQYKDPVSALSTAYNAAWDMLLLRQVRASELGLQPYQDHWGQTTLLTFDKHLAGSAEAVVGSFGESASERASIAGSVALLRRHVQRDILGDEHMDDRLKAWGRQLADAQAARLVAGTPRATDEEMAPHLARALEALFPSPV